MVWVRKCPWAGRAVEHEYAARTVAAVAGVGPEDEQEAEAGPQQGVDAGGDGLEVEKLEDVGDEQRPEHVADDGHADPLQHLVWFCWTWRGVGLPGLDTYSADASD